MYLNTADVVKEIAAGWERLESIVALRGRKFYGAFYPVTEGYRVCVEAKDGDVASMLGLELGSLPGGRYLRARLKGEPPAVYDRIAPTFEAIAETHAADKSRPQIEFYRRRDEIDLLYPVPDAPSVKPA